MFLFKVNSFIRSQDSVFDIFSQVANRQNQGGHFWCIRITKFSISFKII